MNFDLKSPCSNCPFRNDVETYISGERAESISRAIYDKDGTFTCHNHAHSLGLDKEKPEQHCAGAMIILEKMDKPNQLMRIGGRLGYYNPSQLVNREVVYDSLYEFIDSHKETEHENDLQTNSTL